MIKYEDYLDKCWLLSESTASNDVIRSEFDYGTRQRRALRGYQTAGFKITVNASEMVQWKHFWHDLYFGTDKFETNHLIFGVFDSPKVVRFIEPYRLRELSYMRWEVSCSVEILKIKDDFKNPMYQCPIMPFVGRVPGIPAVPCGTN